MNFNHDTGLVDSLLTIDTTVAPPLGGTINSLVIQGTGALYLPLGTNAQRPANTAGAFRYNTDTSVLEFNNGTSWSALSTGGGTVTSVAVTGSTGLSVTGSPITSSGTIDLALDLGLQSLASLASLGIVAQTSTDTFAARTITGTAGNVTVTNGDGVAGNPTINLPDVGSVVTSSFVKITTDTKGRVSATTPVLLSDITTLVDGTYINAAGDSMASGANLAFSGGGTVTGLPSTPTNSDHAASKAYVDAMVQGLDPKASVRVATTAAGTLASSFANGSTIDGITLATGDRILIKNQAAPAENGIYVVNATGSPTRSADMDAWTEVPGSFVFVEVGTTNADTGWVCTSNQGGTLNTTAITWAQFGGAGTYTAGTGLTLTGTQFSLTTPVSIVNGGTGLTSTPTNGQLDIGNGSGFTRTTLTQGTGITVTNGAGSITIANSGVTSIAGTANQISASASTGAVTLSLPTALTAPGSVTVTNNLTVSGLTANAFLYSGTAGILTTTAAPTNGQILIGSTGAAPVAATLTAGTGIGIVNGAGTITISNAGVTGVSASGGTTGLSFSGGPITTTGTLTLAGTLVTANGGTGLSTIGSASQILGVNTSATGLEYKSVSAGTGISVTPSAGALTIANTGVTSVSLSLPNIFSVTGSPVTTTGTLTATLASQTAGTVFAAPAGAAGAPSFRVLALSDLQSAALRLYDENPSTPVAPDASGPNAVALGSNATASSDGSLAVGDGAVASLYGAKAYANGRFTTNGDAQKIQLVARNSTTSATVTQLFLDGSATQMVLPVNSLWTFNIFVSGRRTDATGGGAGYAFSGVIRRDTTTGSVTFVGTPAKSVLGETNTAWDAAVVADTATGALRINVTGEAAKTIRWVASVEATQVTN